MPSVKLLCQDEAFWDVGQGGPEHQPGKHYPRDYAGRVISAIPAACEYSPADTADPRRYVIPLSPSDEDLAAIRSRRLKVGVFGLVDVTFDDRQGAVADKLREKHEDPEAFEREEREAVEAAEAANTAASDLFDLERLAFEIARKDYVRELVAYDALLGGDAPVAPLPPTPPVLTERENAFEREAAELAGSLPPTVTHTGAGLYKVQAAGTMPTPAHLWAMDAVDPPDDGDPGGNPGTGSNVTVVGGQIGSALEFNGSTSIVNVGDVAELNAAQKFTIAFRMNQDVLDVLDALFRKSSGFTYIQLLTEASGTMYFEFRDGVPAPGYARFDYSTVISASSWHQVALVFDGSGAANADRLKIYVDGLPVVLAFTGTAVPAVLADLSGIDVEIGSTTIAFDGKLDDWRIYADGLTDAEVKDVAGRGLTHWDTIVSAVKDNGTTTITLTTGTSEDRTGEVFVSGGNAYAVSAKIDDTHITVIGDASGESGACTVSPYTTIQSALDQLWADQGAGAFTASQYVRVFAGTAGTYDEHVAPNAGLAPSRAGYPLFIEGDPTDDRANISVTPSTGGVGITISNAHTIVRHLAVDASACADNAIESLNYKDASVLDCLITTAPAKAGIYLGASTSGALAEDCVITLVGNSYGIYLIGTARRCTIVGDGSGSGIYDRTMGASRVVSCTMANVTYGYYAVYVEHHQVTVLHCVFFTCTSGVQTVTDTEARFLLVDNIFHSCTYNIHPTSFPEETTARLGPEVILRNNCFYNYTSFAYDGADTKTYAEFIAMNRVDAAGDLDDTDPLLTDPGADDFSLQAASPCKWAGHGSGVVTGSNDVAFDAHHPDIGSWSSGALTVGAPTIMEIAQLTNSSVRLTLTADNAQDVLSIYYRLDADDVLTLFGSTRTGGGTLDVTGLALDKYIFQAVAARAGETSPPSNAMPFTLTDGTAIDVETALYSILTGNAALTALVSRRIYPQAAPQGVQSPYITYTRIDSQHYHHMGGASGLVETRMQIDAWSKTSDGTRPYDEVKDVIEAIRLALDGYVGTVSVGGGSIVIQSILIASETDGYIPPVDGGERGWERVTVDYLVVHAESEPTF